MDNLISQKALLETERLLMTDVVKNNPVAKYILEQVLFDIEHASTEFDKEKVMEQLQEVADLSAEDGLWHIELQEAFAIVKKGGIE